MSKVMNLLMHNTSKLNRILSHNAQMWSHVLVIRHLILLAIIVMMIIGFIAFYNFKKYSHGHKSKNMKNVIFNFISMMVISFLGFALLIPCMQAITYPLLWSSNGELVQNDGYLSKEINNKENKNSRWIRIAHESNYMDNSSRRKLAKLKREVKTFHSQKLQNKHYLTLYYRSNNRAQKHYYHIKYRQSRLKYKIIYKGIKPDVRALYFCTYQNKAPHIVL